MAGAKYSNTAATASNIKVVIDAQGHFLDTEILMRPTTHNIFQTVWLLQ